MRRTFSIVLALGAHALVTLGLGAAAHAAPLQPAQFTVDASGYTVGGIYDVDLNSLVPFPFDSGVQTDPHGGIWQTSIQFTNGASPSVTVNGFRIASTAPGLIEGRGELFYQVRAQALPAYAATLTALPVPMSVTGVTFGSILPIPGGPLAGFSSASVEVVGPGVHVLEGLSASAVHPTWSLPFHRSFSVGAGTTLGVFLMVRGNGNAQWTATADPVFAVDPTATFQHQGQTVRFADAVALEYSPGIAVPEPGAALLALAGLVGLRRAARARRDAPGPGSGGPYGAARPPARAPRSMRMVSKISAAP